MELCTIHAGAILERASTTSKIDNCWCEDMSRTGGVGINVAQGVCCIKDCTIEYAAGFGLSVGFHSTAPRVDPTRKGSSVLIRGLKSRPELNGTIGISHGVHPNGRVILQLITGEKIKTFKIIGCPGCYPTSVLLPLIPLIKKKFLKLENIIIDSKSGYSGAGRGVHIKYKDKNLYESLSAYGIGFHRHNSEIEQMINKYNKSKLTFTFTPHLSPMFKGILSTIYVDINKGKTINDLNNELIKFYKKSVFVKVQKKNTLISTNDTINTNNCRISVCKTKYKNKAIILSSIDNLIKGGAGQAIQNMNILYNFNAKEGLR